MKSFSFTRSPLVWTLAYLFIALGLTYHGFSMGYWEQLVKPSSPVNFLGEARGIRSDDFYVGVPLALSQRQVDFAATNPLIGFGQNNLISAYQIPVKHWVGLFRPLTWGYFLGPNLGMSWHWNLNVILLFLAVLYFLKSFTQLNQKTSLWLSLGFCCSGLFPLWAYLGTPFFYWPIFMVLLIQKFATSNNRGWQWLYGVLFTWVLGCFTFTIYPPFQIFAVYFVAIFALSYLLISQNRKPLLIFYSLALVTILILLGSWYHETKSIFEIISSTVYPGRRFTLGGNGTFLRIFQNNFYAKEAGNVIMDLGGNLCEASGMWSLFIPLGLLTLWQRKSLARREQFVLYFTLAFCLLFSAWYFIGLPAILAKLSGLGMSVEMRSVVLFAFLNLIFLGLYASIPEAKRGLPARRALMMWAAWSILQIIFLVKTCPTNPGVITGAVLMLSFHLAGLWFLLKGQMLRFAQFWAGAMILAHAGFNPIVFGGYEKLFVDSELASAMLRADVAKKETWLVEGELVTTALPRVLGFKSFGGPSFYPQKQFWNLVDEKNEHEQIWNRFANLSIHLTNEPSTKIRLPWTDQIQLELSTQTNLLQTLGVTRIVQVKKKEQILTPPGFNRISETSCCLILGRN